MRRLTSRRLFTPLILLIVLTVFMIVSATSCAPEKADTGKIVVAVTILPQADFVEAVGGDLVEVVVMVPPGGEPHTYELKPDQMAELSQAKIYAKLGSGMGFELAWMDKLVAANKTMLVVDCSRGIELMKTADEDSDEHEGLDSHIWLSVKNAKIMVESICAGLVRIDPADQTYYEMNRDTYLQKLDQLDDELAEGLAKISNRSFITYHPEFGYFARDYNLKQIAIEQAGKEPTADYIVRLIEEARQLNIKVIFGSAQFSTKSAEVIAKEIGGKVIIIDPLAKDFIANMRTIGSVMQQVMQ